MLGVLSQMYHKDPRVVASILQALKTSIENEWQHLWEIFKLWISFDKRIPFSKNLLKKLWNDIHTSIYTQIYPRCVYEKQMKQKMT